MSIRLTVIVNLNDALAGKQFEFGQEMARRDWTQLDSPTFEAEFHGISEDHQALAATEFDLAEAASAAEIDDWDAVCVLGYDEGDKNSSKNIEFLRNDKQVEA